MASPPPRPVVMDPLHITEFASERYFEKLQQEREREGHASTESSAPPLHFAQSSKFILPLRDSRTAESAADPIGLPEQKRRKGFPFRFKSSKSSTSAHDQVYEPRRDSFGESSKARSLPFDQLFVALPTELQIQIIASLPLSDILNLRLASRAWHGMITMNEVPISRYHLDNNIPAYARRLYPLPANTPPSFHHLCGLWHRLHVSAKLAYFVCERVTKEIFLRTTEAQRLEFAPQRERMRRRLIPLIFTIFHFFETYRARHVQYILDHGHGLRQTPYTLNPVEVEVMNMYDDRTLLQVHQVFPLIVASFCRRLRPPSYAGRVERSLRGYIRERPADEVHVAALCIGGLRQVEKFWEIKGYNLRTGTVDNWWKGISQEPEPSNPKPKRGLMGLGRKKSMAALKESKASIAATTNAEFAQFVANSAAAAGMARASVDSGLGRRNSFIFTTSLSAGMPMGPLPREHIRMLLSDLPVLQQLWLVTAEALILDRKIVERSADIKRNAQMMLDLISDGGLAEQDEWWYGHGTSDSIRPPPEAIEDDPE